MRIKTLPLFTFFAIALNFSVIIATEANPAQEVGRVVIVTGIAEADGKRLRPGDRIYLGNVIETRRNAQLKLLLRDRTIVDIGPSTGFRVQDFDLKKGPDREVDSRIDFGQIRSHVTQKLNEKGRFQMRSRSSVLAVRGTEFFFHHDPKSIKFSDQITVSDGKVWVNSLQDSTPKSETVLVPGQQWNNQLVVTPGTQDSGANDRVVLNLSKEDLSKVQVSNNVRDNTFKKLVDFEEASSDKTESSQEKPTENAPGTAKQTESGKEETSAPPVATTDAITTTVASTILAPNAELPKIDLNQVSTVAIKNNPTDAIGEINKAEPNPFVSFKVKLK